MENWTFCAFALRCCFSQRCQIKSPTSTLTGRIEKAYQLIMATEKCTQKKEKKNCYIVFADILIDKYISKCEKEYHRDLRVVSFDPD